jgi:hypothetical protein
MPSYRNFPSLSSLREIHLFNHHHPSIYPTTECSKS